MVSFGVTANEMSIYFMPDLEREFLEERRCHICGRGRHGCVLRFAVFDLITRCFGGVG